VKKSHSEDTTSKYTEGEHTWHFEPTSSARLPWLLSRPLPYLLQRSFEYE